MTCVPLLRRASTQGRAPMSSSTTSSKLLPLKFNTVRSVFYSVFFSKNFLSVSKNVDRIIAFWYIYLFFNI